MALPKFYWANGTSFVFDFFGSTVGALFNPADWNIRALDGKTIYTDRTVVNDPFPNLLDTTLWQPIRVPYPAVLVDGLSSINYGVNWIIDDILNSPVGTPFALGGYSQGAVCAGFVYDQCRQGKLSNRRADLRAVVTFGSPIRELNHTWPGASGFNGAIDIDGSTTSSHGAFPPEYRLKNTESLVWDFVNPKEVSTCMGDSQLGLAIQTALRYTLQNNIIGFSASIIPIILAGGLSFIQNLFSLTETITDPVTGATFAMGGGGHSLYPYLPPPLANGSFPASGDTSYMVAAKYLRTVGQQIYDQMNPTVPNPTTRPTYQWFSSLPTG
jgi:hypothetical protein